MTADSSSRKRLHTVPAMAALLVATAFLTPVPAAAQCGGSGLTEHYDLIVLGAGNRAAMPPYTDVLITVFNPPGNTATATFTLAVNEFQLGGFSCNGFGHCNTQIQTDDNNLNCTETCIPAARPVTVGSYDTAHIVLPPAVVGDDAHITLQYNKGSAGDAAALVTATLWRNPASGQPESMQMIHLQRRSCN